ncbi:bacterial proteasome activator family protein [Rhabdothermincola salaria]|uniref:bacterial proteasome activator family protein n=1 Tax=Rhabdothermincola salaria TaxID=2903142 RepID=UPI001E657810|nr:bacterial proteasome activator family protein [Rhabdothermincola salaria]MCD9622496.1 bacterial proteasome activator family protein [Rhabdothermincola salaria]
MTDAPVERGELITPGGNRDGDEPAPADTEVDENKEFVSEPAKVMRVGSMIKQLLDEVRSTSLDEPSRQRLRAIYDTSITELGSALSPDLQEELERLAFPFAEEGTPSEVELRVAQAQLVGWLEGLFHGIQATLFAQQMAARQQLENMRGQLPPGARPGPPEERPGTYL